MCIHVLFIALDDGKDFKCENPTDSCQHGAILHKNIKIRSHHFRSCWASKQCPLGSLLYSSVTCIHLFLKDYYKAEIKDTQLLWWTKDWQGPFTDHRTTHNSCKNEYFSILTLLIFPYTFLELCIFQKILRESRKLTLKSIPPLLSLACKHVYE